MKKNVASYRVIYGDTDQMGVAYYANYLRWFEMGRTEFLREAGVPYSSIEGHGLYFPVTELSCRYLRPARYDDVVLIETTLTSMGRATLAFNYRLWLEENDVVVATGWTRHACVDKTGHVKRIPADLEETLKSALSSPALSGAGRPPG